MTSVANFLPMLGWSGTGALVPAPGQHGEQVSMAGKRHSSLVFEAGSDRKAARTGAVGSSSRRKTIPERLSESGVLDKRALLRNVARS